MESMSVCQERIKKQNFLKKEILQKGYDAQEFQEFLEGKKYDGGNNIDLWEFEELEEVVPFFLFVIFSVVCESISLNKK